MSVKLVYRSDRQKWQVTHYIGKKRKRPLFENKQVAEAFIRRLQLSLGMEQEGITLEDAIKAYFESVTKRKSSASHATEKRYFNLLFHFLTVERGVHTVPAVTLQDLEAFQHWLLVQKTYDGRPLNMCASTVNRVFSSVRHMFRKFVQWGYRPESPCAYLDSLEATAKPRRAMSVGEFRLALGKAPDWFKPVWTFIYSSGAPPICIERLKWAQVSMSDRLFALTRYKGAKAQQKLTWLPMTDDVFSIFIAMRNKYPTGDHVFRNSVGRPLTSDRCSKTANDAIKAAGLKGLTLYSARHGLASDLTAAGVPTEVVRQSLGHASITTTQRYANKLHKDTLLRALNLVRGDGLVAAICHQHETQLPENTKEGAI
ncbi:MAG: tyrosine-type recombinase/integrase [Pseudobdellovibrionaceae bacterium]